MPDRAITVVVVDDHTLMREGLIALLKKEPSVEVVAEGANGPTAIALTSKFKPDVLLLDLMLPEVGGLEVLRVQVNILAFSMRSDPGFVAEALRQGATGYLLKEDSSRELLDAVRAVSAGEEYLSTRLNNVAIHSILRSKHAREEVRLTPREQVVLELAASGGTSAQIGRHLSISPRTVEMHRTKVMRKLSLASHTDLVRYAIRNRIIGA